MPFSEGPPEQVSRVCMAAVYRQLSVKRDPVHEQAINFITRLQGFGVTDILSKETFRHVKSRFPNMSSHQIHSVLLEWHLFNEPDAKLPFWETDHEPLGEQLRRLQ